MALVALLSNPNSTGNKSLLPQMRCFCASHPDIFHYEVEQASQIGQALESIAMVKPKVLIINGGDGTVQAALTELYHGGHFADAPPPVAVLPNGKTNLIALDLGAEGDPIAALERIIEMARHDMSPHIVSRELIALSDGSENARPVLGMFLGGAGLADAILYCRTKIYPLGLPNFISHILAAFAVFFSTIFGLRASFLPKKGTPLRVSFVRNNELQGSFSVLIVTTLEKLLLGGRSASNDSKINGRLKFLAVDERPWSMLRALAASIGGKLGKNHIDGVHIKQGDIIRIDGNNSSVILDGEIFTAYDESPIVLRSTPPVPFLKIAA
ncbi:diacylglycerol kinase [Sphingorhabdus lutea]|uniref:Diacylglycerol kinase n=1 Tax=Sphingorhabdus lutea TaxID=1913578 RepID=A0A1L3JAF3_9SPHN|nr:diacylglycerol kinase family protein [Sphingorhabdus lutea]APG62107.1 diacylglycerol kinase [Sphingorhabdus lutea]